MLRSPLASVSAISDVPHLIAATSPLPDRRGELSAFRRRPGAFWPFIEQDGRLDAIRRLAPYVLSGEYGLVLTGWLPDPATAPTVLEWRSGCVLLTKTSTRQKICVVISRKPVVPIRWLAKRARRIDSGPLTRTGRAP
jgi:hypothetical protein